MFFTALIMVHITAPLKMSRSPFGNCPGEGGFLYFFGGGGPWGSALLPYRKLFVHPSGSLLPYLVSSTT